MRVSDDGCGMEQEALKHIFDKFYQADTAHATKGNDLGLALAKRVIDLLSGEIYAESSMGNSTVFTVKLKN